MIPIRGEDLTTTVQDLTLGDQARVLHHLLPLFIVYTINQRRPSLARVQSARPAMAC